MNVSAFTLALVPVKTSNLSGQRENIAPVFRLGDQLIAKVLASTSGKLLLEIGGRRLTAETELNFPEEVSLRLEVVQAQPKVRLRVLTDLAPQATVTFALRQMLPNQIPLAQALSAFKAAQTQDLSPQVRAQIEALLNSLPERSALTQPDKLASLVRLSGLFNEALAASEVLLGEADLKTCLLELAAAIKAAQTPHTTSVSSSPAPASSPSPTLQELSAESIADQKELLKTLAEKTSGALARIVLNQLASLPKPDSQFFTWHLTIPYRASERVESLRLTICGERKRESDRGEPSPWTVDLELEPEGLGRIRVKLVLAGNEVSSYFKGEAKTSRLIHDHLDVLAERLRALGLTPYHLKAVAEPQQDPRPIPSVPTVSPLLDEKI